MQDSYSLAYFDNEVFLFLIFTLIKQNDSKPIGHIPIKEIIDLHIDGERCLTIVNSYRRFNLKAGSTDMRNKWFKSLVL